MRNSGWNCGTIGSAAAWDTCLLANFLLKLLESSKYCLEYEVPALHRGGLNVVVAPWLWPSSATAVRDVQVGQCSIRWKISLSFCLLWVFFKKELPQLHSKKTDNPVVKTIKDLNVYFPKQICKWPIRAYKDVVIKHSGMQISITSQDGYNQEYGHFWPECKTVWSLWQIISQFIS